MITAYCIISTLALLFIFTIWSKEGFLNLGIKLLFGVLMILGVVSTVIQLGFHQ